jgi:hypothetical protein
LVSGSSPQISEEFVQGLTGELDLVSGTIDDRGVGADLVGEVEAHRVEAGVMTAGHDELRIPGVTDRVERELGVEWRAAIA